MIILKLAKEWGCTPWEVENNPEALRWAIRQIRLDAVMDQLHGE